MFLLCLLTRTRRAFRPFHRRSHVREPRPCRVDADRFMIRGKGGLEFSPCVLWSVRLFRSLPARRHGRLAHRPTAAAPLPLGHPAACERCVAPEWLSLAGDRGNRRRWVRLFAQAWRDRKFSFQKHPPVRNHKSPIRERGLPGAPQCYSFSDDRPTASNIRLTTSISWRPVSGSRVALAIFASSFVRQFHDIELCCHSGPPIEDSSPADSRNTRATATRSGTRGQRQ